MDTASKERIAALVSANPVVLFMKGKRRLPQCGFSARVVQVLDQLLADYVTVDVLLDPELREAIKVYSDWPTIPQLYVRGEFIGGADIVGELFASGELAALLGAPVREVEPPAIRLSAAAEEALTEALQGCGSPSARVRLEIDASYRPALDLGEPTPLDVRVRAGGLELLLDGASAARAAGIAIDFVPGPDGGFIIDNPNAPPRVRQLRPRELARRLSAREPLRLIDVRTPEERELARLEDSRLLDAALASELEALDRDVPLVFVCHHGSRSQAAAQRFLALGFRTVFNLAGGLDAWSREVDASVPRY
jgi:monothiol glutaredoxin